MIIDAFSSGGKKKTKSQSLDGTIDKAIAVDLYTTQVTLICTQPTQVTQALNLLEALLIYESEHSSFAKTLNLKS
jgi:hypothetical protein